jgi:hypothetical protein
MARPGERNRGIGPARRAALRFKARATGYISRMFRTRYALLGWLAWRVGKRMMRRKLHLSRR